MIVAEQARARLEALGLTQAAAVLDGRLDVASQNTCSCAESLADLLEAEVRARRERYLKARTGLAHFPFHKTLDAFDFAFQPSVDERLVRELAGLAFIHETANIVLLGPPGTGKTHLAVALGMQEWPTASAPTSPLPTPSSKTCAGPTRSTAWNGACASISRPAS